VEWGNQKELWMGKCLFNQQNKRYNPPNKDWLHFSSKKEKKKVLPFLL